MSDELQKMKTMSDAGANYGLDLGTSTIAPPQKDCFVIPVPCPLLSRYFDTQNMNTSARHKYDNYYRHLPFDKHFIFRSLNSPPILNLIYNYDENGVIRKHNQDLNETFMDGNQDVAFPSENMTILWNLSKNGSVEMDNLVDLQDVFVGKEIHFHSSILKQVSPRLQRLIQK